MEYSIRCQICSQPMKIKVRPFYPGTSDKVIEVEPCCVNEDLSDEITYLKEDFTDSFEEFSEGLVETFDDLLDADSDFKEVVQEYMQDLANLKIELAETLSDIDKALVDKGESS